MTARSSEVAAGTWGHELTIELGVDLTVDSPALSVEFRMPDEVTTYSRSASINPADATNKTLIYTTASGDLGDENDRDTWGEYRIVAVADYGANGYHKGRPALRITAADPWS